MAFCPSCPHFGMPKTRQDQSGCGALCAPLDPSPCSGHPLFGFGTLGLDSAVLGLDSAVLGQRSCSILNFTTPD